MSYVITAGYTFEGLGAAGHIWPGCRRGFGGLGGSLPNLNLPRAKPVVNTAFLAKYQDFRAKYWAYASVLEDTGGQEAAQLFRAMIDSLPRFDRGAIKIATGDTSTAAAFEQSIRGMTQMMAEGVDSPTKLALSQAAEAVITAPKIVRRVVRETARAAGETVREAAEGMGVSPVAILGVAGAVGLGLILFKLWK